MFLELQTYSVIVISTWIFTWHYMLASYHFRKKWELPDPCRTKPNRIAPESIEFHAPVVPTEGSDFFVELGPWRCGASLISLSLGQEPLGGFSIFSFGGWCTDGYFFWVMCARMLVWLIFVEWFVYSRSENDYSIIARNARCRFVYLEGERFKEYRTWLFEIWETIETYM